MRRLASGLDPVRCSRQRAPRGVIDDPARNETVHVNLCEHPDARVAWSVGGGLYEEEPGRLSQDRAAGLGAAGVELELDHTALAEERHDHADVQSEPANRYLHLGKMIGRRNGGGGGSDVRVGGGGERWWNDVN